jgi:hypothetical protein
MEDLSSATGESAALELLATSCASASCPTIFKSPSGSYVIQGYVVDAEKAGVTLSAGEMLVEIPAELLEFAMSK